MGIKIILDTNTLLGKKSFKNLFGNKVELESVLAMGDIEFIIPSMVIDELIHQKEIAFQTSKQRFTSNVMYNSLDDESRSKIESNILSREELLLDRVIPYKTIDILNKVDALEKIRDLAVNYMAPFQVYSGDNDNADKGFKDAYIALTVDEYLKKIPIDEKIIFFTHDPRLAEYFDGNDRVIWANNIKQIREYITSIEPSVAGDAEAVGNINKLKLPTADRISVIALLSDFRNSSSFVATHSLISRLCDVINKLSSDDMVDVLISTAQNTQINWLLQDDDVKNFIQPIFEKYKDKLNINQYNTIAQGLGGYTLKIDTVTAKIEEIGW